MTPEEARSALTNDVEQQISPTDAEYAAEASTYKPPRNTDLKDLGSDLNAYMKATAYGGDTLTHGITGPIMENFGPEWMARGSRNVAANRAAGQKALSEEHPIASFLGDLSGKALVSAPLNTALPGSSSNFVTRAGNNAIAGLGSGLAEYGPLENRLESGVLNAGGSLIFPEFLRAAGSTLGRTVSKSEFPEHMQQLINTSEKEQIPILAQDMARPGSMVDKLGVLSEKPIFFNTVGKRLAQQEAAHAAAERVSQKYSDEMIQVLTNNKQNGLARLEQIANSKSNRAPEARRLLDAIDAGGEDWNYILKSSGNQKLLENKLVADELYDTVSKIAATKGDINVSPVVKQLDGFLEQLNRFPETNKDAIKALSEIRKDLIKRTPEVKPSNILGTNGQPISAGQAAKEAPQQLTFDELRDIRSTLNDKISDFQTGKNTLIGKKGVQNLIRVRDGIEGELEKFATTNGDDLKRAWKDADAFYKKEVVPFKDLQLAKALKGESNPDEIFKMFIKSGGDVGDFGTGRAVKFFKALDAKGQSAVRYGIVKNALYNSVDEKGAFSPAKYASYLEKLKAARSVFFHGEHGQQIDGLANFMRHIERSGQMKPPDTGVQALGYMLAGKMGNMGIEALIGTNAGFLGLQKLLTTRKGQSFLLASAKLPENSPKWKSLIHNIGELMKTNASTVGRALAQKKEVTTPAVSAAINVGKDLLNHKETKE